MKTGEKQSLSVFLGVLLFFLPVVSIFFLFSEGFSNLLVKYFPAEQKQSPGNVPYKRCLKYLTKLIRKHLYQSLSFQQSCRIETYNFIENSLQHRCFSVNFAKYLRTPILQNIYQRRSYLCENISYMKFLVSVYLTEKCLPWYLLNKAKKWVSFSEVSKTLEIYKKPV